MLIHSSNNYNKTNFGMAIKSTKQAAEFLETHLTPSGAKYLNKIIESQAKNPVDILLRLEKAQSGHPWAPYIYDILVADVKNETYRPWIFGNKIFGQIKRAVKQADKLSGVKNTLKLDIKG